MLLTIQCFQDISVCFLKIHYMILFQSFPHSDRPLACKDPFFSDQSTPFTCPIKQSGDGGLYAECQCILLGNDSDYNRLITLLCLYSVAKSSLSASYSR